MAQRSQRGEVADLFTEAGADAIVFRRVQERRHIGLEAIRCFEAGATLEQPSTFVKRSFKGLDRQSGQRRDPTRVPAGRRPCLIYYKCLATEFWCRGRVLGSLVVNRSTSPRHAERLVPKDL